MIAVVVVVIVVAGVIVEKLEEKIVWVGLLKTKFHSDNRIREFLWASHIKENLFKV